jgi:glycosyltransferase involved in cell wall biosynthesis
MESLGLSRPLVVCYDSPKQQHLVGTLEEDLAVYYVSDDFTVTLKGDVIAGELEAERNLLKKVDLVISINERLAQSMRERMDPARPLPIHLMPNFYDECLFNPDIEFDEPQGLKGIPHPRVLVAGHISDRIDWDGISAASRLRSQWTWVFLGRVTDPGTKETIRSRLGARGMLLPAVPYSEVPAWIRHCDTCAIPYRLNAFTLASDPLKAPEQLAMGAPVLSTRIPALSRFGEAIYWIEEGNGESYAKALDAALSTSGDNELSMFRRRAAASDSLAVRADQFRTIVLEHLDPAPAVTSPCSRGGPLGSPSQPVQG